MAEEIQSLETGVNVNADNNLQPATNTVSQVDPASLRLSQSFAAPRRCTGIFYVKTKSNLEEQYGNTLFDGFHTAVQMLLSTHALSSDLQTLKKSVISYRAAREPSVYAGYSNYTFLKKCIGITLFRRKNDCSLDSGTSRGSEQGGTAR